MKSNKWNIVELIVRGIAYIVCILALVYVVTIHEPNVQEKTDIATATVTTIGAEVFEAWS